MTKSLTQPDKKTNAKGGSASAKHPKKQYKNMGNPTNASSQTSGEEVTSSTAVTMDGILAMDASGAGSGSGPTVTLVPAGLPPSTGEAAVAAAAAMDEVLVVYHAGASSGPYPNVAVAPPVATPLKSDVSQADALNAVGATDVSVAGDIAILRGNDSSKDEKAGVSLMSETTASVAGLSIHDLLDRCKVRVTSYFLFY